MRNQALVVGISLAALALTWTGPEAAAQAQQGAQTGQAQQPVQPEGGMMGGGMMGRGMMPGMMGQEHHGPMRGGMMLRMMFSLMDADGDGSISLQEFQAAHERIFKGMDINKDGRVTMEEMRAFMRGGFSP
jgi:hypothetical protein